MDFASAKYDVADAFAANELYQDNGWTDGLPIVPPTDTLVRAFTEHARRQVANGGVVGRRGPSICDDSPLARIGGDDD